MPNDKQLDSASKTLRALTRTARRHLEKANTGSLEGAIRERVDRLDAFTEQFDAIVRDARQLRTLIAIHEEITESEHRSRPAATTDTGGPGEK